MLKLSNIRRYSRGKQKLMNMQQVRLNLGILNIFGSQPRHLNPLGYLLQPSRMISGER